MRKVVLRAIRGLGILVILALVPIAFAPSGSANNPYVSALSRVMTEAFADPTCEDKACDANGNCKHTIGWRCQSVGAKCVNDPC